MSRWNFKNHGNSNDLNNKYINANRPLDTNPDHYKSSYGNGIRRGRDERVSDPTKRYDPVEEEYYSNHPKPNYQRNYVEGVVIHFIDGSFFKTKELTAQRLSENLRKALSVNDSNTKWLALDNGGAINLKQVTYYTPYKFYENSHRREDY